MVRRIQSDEEVIVLEKARSLFPAFLEGITFASKCTETPDFIGEDGSNQKIGLELTRWLNQEQTKAAVNHERTRATLLEIIASERHPRPMNIRSSVVTPRWDIPVPRADYQQLGIEFHLAAHYISNMWSTLRSKHWKPLRPGDRFDYEAYPANLKQFPTLCRYVSSIWFVEPDKSSAFYSNRAWVSVLPDGGLYETRSSIDALRNVIESKVTHYSSGSARVLLSAHNLSKIYLLVYTDPVRFTSNTSYQTPAQMMKSPTEGLAEVASAATNRLSSLPKVFDGVFLFYSVWGTSWLAQIWPNFGLLGLLPDQKLTEDE